MSQSANIDTTLIDDAYPPSGTLPLAEFSEAAGCRVGRIFRIETLAESLLASARSAKDLGQAMVERLEDESSLVALKTIIAYRSGLAVETPGEVALQRAFDQTRAEFGYERPRLTAKPLLDYLLALALEWAVERDLPVQIHTGFGDRDLDLVLANPALLRPLLELPRYDKLKLVLLHAGYPYSREASYLASVYPNVYVDWSEANPLLTPRQLIRLLEESLALSPVTKLLYGSDAWGIPDWLWLGARAGRAALAAALDDEPNRDLIAQRILRENAYDLYRLGG